MTLIIDAAPLLAVADEREPRREAIIGLLRTERGGLFVPAPVTAEIDYLLGRRFGTPARRAFLADLAARRYESPALDPHDYETVLELERRYADLDAGLADFSIVVLARNIRTRPASSPSTSAIFARCGHSRRSIHAAPGRQRLTRRRRSTPTRRRERVRQRNRRGGVTA